MGTSSRQTALDIPTIAAYHCGTNEWSCEYYHQCVLSKYQCDGINQCTDGSDEYDCIRTTGIYWYSCSFYASTCIAADDVYLQMSRVVGMDTNAAEDTLEAV